MASGVPTWRMRPSDSTAMRSERLNASLWSWVTKIVVTPSLRWISFNSSCIEPRRFLSSAENGSSSSSTFGEIASARARATRCCWPPDNCRGLRVLEPMSRTSASTSATCVDFRLGLPPHLKAISDIRGDIHVREERVVLKEHSDFPPVRRNVRHRPAVNMDRADIRREKTGDHIEQRRLAAAGGAEQGQDFAAANIELASCSATTSPKCLDTPSSARRRRPRWRSLSSWNAAALSAGIFNVQDFPEPRKMVRERSRCAAVATI